MSVFRSEWLAATSARSLVLLAWGFGFLVGRVDRSSPIGIRIVRIFGSTPPLNRRAIAIRFSPIDFLTRVRIFGSYWAAARPASGQAASTAKPSAAGSKVCDSHAQDPGNLLVFGEYICSGPALMEIARRQPHQWEEGKRAGTQQ